MRRCHRCPCDSESIQTANSSSMKSRNMSLQPGGMGWPWTTKVGTTSPVTLASKYLTPQDDPAAFCQKSISTNHLPPASSAARTTARFTSHRVNESTSDVYQSTKPNRAWNHPLSRVKTADVRYLFLSHRRLEAARGRNCLLHRIAQLRTGV